MKNKWLGLDIGGTKCAVLLATLDNGIRILDKIRFDTHTELGFNQAYDKLVASIEEILRRNDTATDSVQAIGISCGGPLDSRKGVVLCPPNLPGWENVPLVKMLEEKFGIPSFIQNDANACALVEWKMGAGRGTQDMVFLTFGTGMGGGVISEGRLVRGHTDMGGEVGHLSLTKGGPIGFGKEGSFEGYASGGGIHRQAVALTKQLIEAGTPPVWVKEEGLPEIEWTAKAMADYARAGDKDAKALWVQVGHMLGEGLALIVDTLNPERIVIGSIFARCEDLLREPMEEILKKEAIPFSLEGLSVVPAQTGEQLGDFASIMVALYAMNVDPMSAGAETKKEVLTHYERLFERYPALNDCRDQVMNAYTVLKKCYEKGGKVLLVGNGGSCADCEHIAGELMKGFWLKRPLDEKKQAAIRALTEEILPGTADLLQQGLPAIVLTNHNALSTAVQNDLDPNLAAAQQVVAYSKPEDVLIGISTSGNAKNVALAMSTAKALGLSTIALTGEKGGRLRGIADVAVCVPGCSPADVQELHLPVYHTLCAMVEAKFFDK